jgi:predicted nucleic acid-binding protein
VIAYVDTSVLLRCILEGDIALHQAFRADRTIASELILIEARRVLERHRMNSALDDEKMAEASSRLMEVYASFEVWNLSDAIKARAAGTFPTVVGTLDALHLATALAGIETMAEASHATTLALYSYDRQMNLCAKALGLAVPLF